MDIKRRTFEAKKHAKGSEERKKLNLNAETSEYMPSYKYLLVDGNFNRSFRTKKEAQQAVDRLNELK